MKSMKILTLAALAVGALLILGSTPAVAQGRYLAINRISPEARDLIDAGVPVHSVPHWSSSFTTAGITYPFTMVGRDPTVGGSVVIQVPIIPVDLEFEGTSVVTDVAPVIPLVKSSPNFQDAQYTVGVTQFADAVQRAEFFSITADTWHTLLNSNPPAQASVIVRVPSTDFVLRSPLPGGIPVACVDFAFLDSQLRAILQAAQIPVHEFPILLTRNVFLYENGDPTTCGIGGYHTARDASHNRNVVEVETWSYVSWGDPGGPFKLFLDVAALSHETSEWINDPFVNNLVPVWQFPGQPGHCQNNLETGDPVEVLPNPLFPVTINGFTYHPQTEALLQWFSREVPSSAIDGAYSYPDETALTSPSQPCP